MISSAASEDAIYTMDELIKRRAAEMKDSPLLCFPDKSLTDYEEHSAESVDRYIDAAVDALKGRGLEPADAQLEQSPTIAILAHSSMQFLITLLSLNRLGYAALLLSPRLASPAIESLLKQAECNTILTTSHFRPILEEVSKDQKLNLLEMLGHEEYYGVKAPTFHRDYDPLRENPKQAVIIHSSGSTGLPKPIYLTHRSCIAAFAINMNRRGLMTQPLFHSFGFYETFRAIYSGKPMFYVNYNFPLTAQNLRDTIEHVKPDLLLCVPYVLKLLASSDEGVRSLEKIDLILYGGSACPDDLGDRLVQAGVNICANFGATETGRMMTSERPKGDLAWNYLRILSQTKAHVWMDEIAPGIYEAVALEGLKSRSTTNCDDPPNSFRTRDLFTPHPDQPDWWKYVSRLDDRLTLVNGEKVLPIPMEGRVRQEALVKEAIVFGEGRIMPGILVVKADAAASLADKEFLEEIWPAIGSANSCAESFAQISRDLVVILPHDTIYAVTDKSTFIRAQAYTQFKDQIEKAYAKFESDTAGVLTLSLPDLEQHLLRLFREHLDVELKSTETDFFALGIDSLQCLRIWGLIKREIDLGGRQAEVSQNVLYETGNIGSLARYLDGLRNGTPEDKQDQTNVMKDLITKYSSFGSSRERSATSNAKQVVMLTGVTGGLGAHLLAQLIQSENVSQVWALVRASSDSTAMARTIQSLSDRGLYPSGDQLKKIVAVSSDLSRSDFGLGTLILEVLRSKLTLVIHSAWAVNFNISVQSFEDQHISAVYNIIKLCQSKSHDQARFFFCSSVSSAGGTPRPGVVSEGPVLDISHVQGTGYARSKYVAEHIVLNAAKIAGADARVLRIGQLVGDTKVGQWNTSEGIPLMIQTAATLGALPHLNEEMSWLPVDYAARIILDLCDISNEYSPSQMDNFDSDVMYHVVNPTRFHWAKDMLPALSAAGLQFEILPTAKWMERLRNSDKDPNKNPPVKLLDWFESKYGHGASSKNEGPLIFATEQTGNKSRTLAKIPDVTDVTFVSLMLKRLRRQW